MASRLSEIRENIHLIQSVGMLYPEEIVSAKEGDICIAYMFPRYCEIPHTASIIIVSTPKKAEAADAIIIMITRYMLMIT